MIEEIIVKELVEHVAKKAIKKTVAKKGGRKGRQSYRHCRNQPLLMECIVKDLRRDLL